MITCIAAISARNEVMQRGMTMELHRGLVPNVITCSAAIRLAQDFVVRLIEAWHCLAATPLLASMMTAAGNSQQMVHFAAPVGWQSQNQASPGLPRDDGVRLTAPPEANSLAVVRRLAQAQSSNLGVQIPSQMPADRESNCYEA